MNADLVTLALTEDMVGSDKLQIGVTDSLGNFVSSSVAITSITPVLSIAASTSATVMAGVSTAVPGINLSEPGAVVGETFTVNFGVTKGVLDITSPGVAGSGTFE